MSPISRFNPMHCFSLPPAWWLVENSWCNYRGTGCGYSWPNLTGRLKLHRLTADGIWAAFSLKRTCFPTRSSWNHFLGGLKCTIKIVLVGLVTRLWLYHKNWLILSDTLFRWPKCLSFLLQGQKHINQAKLLINTTTSKRIYFQLKSLFTVWINWLQKILN